MHAAPDREQQLSRPGLARERDPLQDVGEDVETVSLRVPERKARLDVGADAVSAHAYASTRLANMSGVPVSAFLRGFRIRFAGAAAIGSGSAATGATGSSGGASLAIFKL